MDRRSASFRGGNEASGWRTGRRGFSLIELMLVVTLLAIILAMAIPAFLSSRKHANEVSAISSLRTLSSIQNVYRIRFGTYGTLQALGDVQLVDNNLGSGRKAGYTFTVSGSGISDCTWAFSAAPVEPGVTGDRWFFVDESGVIRGKEGSEASTSDSPIQ